MNYYIVSCNPDKFDIVDHFKNSVELLWKRTNTFMVGDQVYIYVGRPFSRLMFSCEVTENDILSIPKDSNYYSVICGGRNKDKPFVKMILKERLPEEKLSLPELITHGLKTVQCSTKANDELINYIKYVVEES